MSASPTSVLGTATVFLRPLRFLFDIEGSVAILSTDSDAKSVGSVLGTVHVHISISSTHTLETKNTPDELLPPPAVHGEELRGLLGRFVWIHVRLQRESGGSEMVLRVQYQFSPASESFVFPLDHEHAFKLLVTEELITHINTQALQFNLLPKRIVQRDDVDEREVEPKPVVVDKSAITQPQQQQVVQVMVPVKSEETEAALAATSAAASAAETAANAARQAAAAATAAMEVARESAKKDVEKERQQAKTRDDDQAKSRAIEMERVTKERELERLQMQHELERVAQAKAQVEAASQRLEAELRDKQMLLDKWKQQTSQTDQAVEILKQRMASDAKEREEYQKRLRVLEEEKLEYLKKQGSRACTIQ